MNIVGKNVHKYRKALGLSLQELGDKAGWDKKNLNRLEQFGTGYSHDSISRLSHALGVSLGALFEESFEGLKFGRPIPLHTYNIERVSISEGKVNFITPTTPTSEDLMMTDGLFGESAFGWEVGDDAMWSERVKDLKTGDRAIVDPELDPEANDAVLAIVNRSGRPTISIRRYAEREGGYVLIPNNDGFAAESSDSPNVAIIGVVVEERRRRRSTV